jgi:GT2 family glycosyltransferase
MANQTVIPEEIIVADGSDTAETAAMVNDEQWRRRGLNITLVSVTPPNAVRQRNAAIAISRGEFLMLLDDDVVLDPNCVERLLTTIRGDSSVVGVTADFNNETWSHPTLVWRLYLRYMLRMHDNEWQGRVVGPLLRFGYNPVPAEPRPMEWLGTCNSIVRRSSYIQVGGFSDFFLHRCTMNEDVDLGIKLSRVGKIMFCPAARMAHEHAPGGRVSLRDAAEDDLYNRYFIFRKTYNHCRLKAFGLVALYFALETSGSLVGCMYRRRFEGFTQRLIGRLDALHSILASRP